MEYTNPNHIRTSQTVALPGWNGEAFVCELRRPSLLAMAASGAIPNPLMKTARQIFLAGVSPSDGNLAEEGRVLIEIAKAALVSPSFDDLRQRDIELTDEQLAAIFRFSQTGAASLDRFRPLSADSDGAVSGTAVPGAAE